jgi:alkylated DNA repair protein (DNA oxidative demethylase)
MEILAGLQPDSDRLALAQSAYVLHRFAAAAGEELVQEILSVAARAPFRNMITPGGRRMSVAMTNCGNIGWVTDAAGYRYQAAEPWPAMPTLFADFALRAAQQAGFDNFHPDACLINRYEPGTRLTLHQDRDEKDFEQPIVSVSLGLPCKFLFGGTKRSDRVRRILLEHGDVVVWGGISRLVYHGVDTLADGTHPLTGSLRYNLTFRRAQ